jgi:hypothetical protein
MLDRSNRTSLEQTLELFSVRAYPVIRVGPTVGFAVVQRGAICIEV